jgi:predicted MFS family arabinose efflux permease
VRLAINLGWGVGIAVGGFLASINYHLLFWVDGGTSMLAATCLLFLLPKNEGQEHRNAMANLSSQEKNAAAAHKDRTFWWFLAFIVLFASCFFQLFTTVPIYFKEVLMMDEYHIGMVMSLNGILIAVVEMPLVFKIEGRKPYLMLIAAGTLLMGLSFLLLNIPLLGGMLIAVLFVLVLTVAEIISMPFMNSYYISRTKEHNRGAYAGMYTMAWSAAQVIGSSSGAVLAHNIGFVNLWFLAAFVCVLAAMGFYQLHQRSPKWATS